MTTAEQKAVVRRYYEEIWNGGNLALVDDLMAPDYANIDPASPAPEGIVRGREGMKQLVGTYRAAVPDLRMTIEEQFADGEVVVSRWTVSGTQRGPLLGIPASGRFATMSGITITRFRHDQIVEDRVNWDALGLLRQIGAISSPEPAAG